MVMAYVEQDGTLSVREVKLPGDWPILSRASTLVVRKPSAPRLTVRPIAVIEAEIARATVPALRREDV